MREALRLKSIHSIWSDVTDINSDGSIAWPNVELAFTIDPNGTKTPNREELPRRAVSVVKQTKTDIRVLIFGWSPMTMTMAYFLQ